MEKTLAELSPAELEALIERTIDRRLNVWLTQLLDALTSNEEDDEELQSEFAASLRRALQQAQAGEGVSLAAFRDKLGR